MKTDTCLGGLRNAGFGRQFTGGYGTAALAVACGTFVPMRREIAVRTPFPYRASGIPQGATS
jgi:hypothetical protein